MRDLGCDEFDLLTLKNVIIAPFFEEFIYRVVIINIFLEADVMSVNKCVLILPLFFAIGKLSL
jgi:membrane protease YdiL (CAAX protease family)